MKFKLKDNALKYLNKKSINKIFINPDIETKKDCCGLATMDFNISTKRDDENRYKVSKISNISVFYNPTLDLYLDDKKDEEIIISAIGIGKFKKLYVENELNIIER
ncbi:hypothetical protein [Peptoniphilus rhinitidis]|uniref:hypothetical protein n=1 Tax=Peptoniphilus rhinitidis TaxID=1175452 RepID=UPI0002889AFF|nr:hypothetical protein [Peptoniphilus rhinitidis]